ncbi:MAG TPA: transglycosylase SLT domain-containing protein [Haliangiales bacterium]|nr:transglycosylase SLT domain-containing protein [Haliangiales bacterium]
MRVRAALLVCLVGSAAHAADAPFPDTTPFFGDLAASADLAAGRFREARDGFAAARERASAEPARARLGFLAAWCDRRLGNHKDAATGFDAAGEKLPLLREYARYFAGMSYYKLRDWDAAEARARDVPEGAVLYAEAQLLLGDVLRARGDAEAIFAHYDGYLRRFPQGIRAAEARFWLAGAEEARGHAAEAVALYHRILVDAPLEGWADKARARIEALLPDKKERAAALALAPRELADRGKVYFDAMRNELAEADFAALLKVKTIDAGLRCFAAFHLAQTVFKERQRARSAPLFDDAIAACARTKDADLQSRSAYQGGRAWGAAGDPKKAIERFEKAETWHPEHTIADDARLRQSEQWQILEDQGEKGATEKLVAALEKLPEKFPNGDMKAEALWRLAWRAWRAEKYDEAVGWLEKQIAAVPHEENYWAEGQTHYWIGRAKEKLGKPAEAKDAYLRAVREYPLGYYALLALNRLRERHPDAFSAIVAEIAQPPARPPARLAFAPRAVYADPYFQRGVELLRLGLGAEAERELSRAGLRVPDGRQKVTDPARQEDLWATAFLYDRARRWDRSHWIARWHVLDYKLAWPTADTRGKWDIAYPRGYWHLVEPAAKQLGYPPELLEAFVREESAFDPVMESFANAIGLTQMIVPTAQRFGKGLGFDISRETLRDPEKNVAVGSRWLAFLWTTFGQNLPLVIASYNAGEGAVWRWLCQRGDWALDEFGEAIPFDETRNYTKRVLASFFAYAYLNDRTIPVVGNDIPKDVINEKKCPAAKGAAREGELKPDKK